LHFSRRLCDQWSVFAETALTARPGGGYTASLERIIARYRYSDLIKITTGRFHTPVNWWNETFHHGKWLQTTIDRPEMTRFGGKFVPVHFVGVLEEGTAPLGAVSLSWTAGIGNGRQSNIAGAGEGGDVDTRRAWLAGISLRPDRFYNLQIGVSAYGDAVPLEGQEAVEELLLAGHLVWYGEAPEVIVEYAHIVHQGIDGAEDGQNFAWYGQLAWRLPIANEILKPYVRYDQVDIDANDPVYRAPLASSDAPNTQLFNRDLLTAGLRVDVASLVALKGEYRRIKEEDLDWYNAYVASLELSF